VARRAVRRTSRQQPIGPLERRNLDAGAADSIRRLIFNRHFPTGAHIVEANLAAALGVSHGTVRAALQQLRHEGLVEYRPNRGIFVKRLESRDAWEVYTLRNTLEAMAARLAAERVTDTARQELRAILEQMRKAVQKGDRAGAIRSDFEFHRLVMRLSGHRLLQRNYRLLELQTRLFMALTDVLHTNLSHFLPLHEPLIDSIAAGDPDRAEALASQHNNPDGERLIRHMEHVEVESHAVLSDLSSST